MNEDETLMNIVKKIEREKALLHAATLMRQQTNNEQVRSKLDTQMREGKRNIQFFEDKMAELQARRGMSDLSLASSSTAASSSRPPSAIRGDSEGPPAPPPKDASQYGIAGGDGSSYGSGSTQYSQLGQHGDMMPPRGPFAAPPPSSGLPKPRANFTKLGMSTVQQTRCDPLADKTSLLDLIKYDTPYLGPRIQLMLSQIQFKLNVEEQYLKGIEKMVQLYQMEGDKKSRADAAARKVESKQKIVLLKQALKRYEELHIDFDTSDPADGSSPFNACRSSGLLTPFSHR